MRSTENPTYKEYMDMEVKKGDKRVCWNSIKAPHNFEGFFMNMGDMLVRKGEPELARKIYANAKLSKSFSSWPFRNALEQRIKNAEKNVEPFRKIPLSGEKPGHLLMFNSQYACMACHQKR